jgi:hypothetical protein
VRPVHRERRLKGGAVTALYVPLALVAVGFIAVVGLVLIVSAGIKREERQWSLCRKRAPGFAARVARRVGGLYVKKTEPEDPEEADPEPGRPRYEHCA